MNGQAPKSWQEGLTGGAEAFLRNFLMFKQMQAQKSQQLLQMAQTGMLPPEYIQSPEFAQAVGKGMWGRGGKPTQYQVPTQGLLAEQMRKLMAGEEVPAETQILLGIPPEIAPLTPEQRAERAQVIGGLQLSKAEETTSFTNFLRTMDAGTVEQSYNIWSAMTGQGEEMTDEARQTLLSETKIKPWEVQEGMTRVRANLAQNWMQAGLDYNDSIAVADSFLTGQPLPLDISDKTKAISFDIRLAKKAEIKSAMARAKYWDDYGTWMRARIEDAKRTDPELANLLEFAGVIQRLDIKGMGKEGEQLVEDIVNAISSRLRKAIPGLAIRERKEKKGLKEKLKEIFTPTAAESTWSQGAPGTEFAPPGEAFTPTGEAAVQTIPEPAEITPELLEQLYYRLKESKWDDERIRKLFEAEGYPIEGIPFEEK